MSANQHYAESSDVSYELCSALIRCATESLRDCEALDDPAAARARFDLLREFTKVLNQQVPRLADAAARETCALQLDTLIQIGRRLAPTIPYICPRCDIPWLPEKEPKTPVCPDCQAESSASAPAVPGPSEPV